MRVKLIQVTQNPIDVMWTAARTCYSAKSPVEMWEEIYYPSEEWQKLNDENYKQQIEKHWNLVKKVLDSGHQSIAEHVYFTFAIEGISRACYDAQTEVLTNNGWKLFKDLNKEDLIASKTANGYLQFEKPVNYITYDYNGSMHHYKSKAVDLVVTPNHKMYCKKYNERHKDQPYQLIASEDIDVSRICMDKRIFLNKDVEKFVTIDGYSYERANNNQGFYEKEIQTRQFDKELFTKFLAFYISEGNTYYDEKENKYQITIAQRNKSMVNGNYINEITRKEIKEVIEGLGFNCYEMEGGLRFNSPLLGPFLKNLGISVNKYFPFNIFEYFNEYYAKLFIDTYSRYDATIYKDHLTLYTSSEKLKDDLQLIAGIAGYSTRIIINKKQGTSHTYNESIITSNKNCYALSLSNKKNLIPFIKKNRHFSIENYNGKVYCVEVPSHVILVRRNGLICWCGNCSHQLVRHRAGIVFSQQSQRYVSTKNPEDLYNFMCYVKKGQYDLIKEQELDKKILGQELPEQFPGDLVNEWGRDLLEKYFVQSETYTGFDADKNILANSEFRDAFYDAYFSYCKLQALGLKGEDARNVLPNATKTNITMSVNFRELIHLCNLRLCTRAQKEIRDLFKLIVKEVKAKDERLASYLVPQCEVLGICTEHSTCGRKPHISDVMRVYEDEKANSISKEDMETILNPKTNEKLKQFMEQPNILEK